MAVASPTLSFRPLTAADLDSALFWEGDRHYGAQWLDRQAAGECYVGVCCADGVSVGRGGLNFTWANEPGLCHLWSLLVLDHVRGRGFGSALIRHLHAEAARHGCTQVELGVEKTNVRAERLYRRLGYRRVGETVDSWTQRRPDGSLAEVVADCWTMRLPLD